MGIPEYHFRPNTISNKEEGEKHVRNKDGIDEHRGKW